MIPDLPAGSYMLEVRTHYTSNNAVPGKQLRKTQFSKALNV